MNREVHRALRRIKRDAEENKETYRAVGAIGNTKAIQMKPLNELAKEIHETAKAKGWHPPGQERRFGELIALVHSEVTEMLEAYRETGSPTESWTRADGKPEGVPSEMADVVIRLLDMAARFGIDIEQAIETKMAFNRTRPHRHGGKHL